MLAAFAIRNQHPLIPASNAGLLALGYDVFGLQPHCLSAADHRHRADLLVLTGLRPPQREMADAYRDRIPVVCMDLPHVRGLRDVRVFPPDHTWLPDVTGLPDRAERLGVEVLPRRRGKQGKDGYALVIGQVPDDSSHYMNDKQLLEWAAKAVKDVREALPDTEIVWRPHPVTRNAPELHKVPGVDTVQLPQDVDIEDAIDGARVVVTYSSTTGFEAIVRGCPVVAYGRTFYSDLANNPSQIAKARAATSKDVKALLERVGYTQWSKEEIATGEPFRFVIEQAQLRRAA